MAKKDDSPFITTGERVRHFLGWAFVLSLVLHTLAIPLFPDLNKHHEDQQVEKVSVTKKIRVRVPTPPPPTPAPPPTPTPPPQATPPPKKQTAPQPKLKLNVPKTSNSSSTSSTTSTYTAPKSGSEAGVPAGQGTASPSPATPAPTLAPACANPTHDATVTNPQVPDYPSSARDLNLGPVTVQVEVTVSATGSLVDAKIYKSSGNFAIDRNALLAARQSSYAPAAKNCTPVQGHYLFRMDFTAD